MWPHPLLTAYLATFWEVRAIAGSVFTAVLSVFSSGLLMFAAKVPAHVHSSVYRIRVQAFSTR